MEKPSAFDQIYAILYGSNTKIASHSIATRMPPSVNCLLSNKKIVDILLTLEPGPAVDYHALLTNLRVLEHHMRGTPSGPGLINFFENLMQFRTAWLNSIAQQTACYAHDQCLKTYFVDGQEAAQISIGEDLNDEGYMLYQQECKEFATQSYQDVIHEQRNHLAAMVAENAMDLFQYKSKPAMRLNCTRLLIITHQYKIHVAALGHVAQKQRLRVDAGSPKSGQKAKKNVLLQSTKVQKPGSRSIVRSRTQIKGGNRVVKQRQMGTELVEDADLIMAQELLNYMANETDLPTGSSPETSAGGY